MHVAQIQAQPSVVETGSALHPEVYSSSLSVVSTRPSSSTLPQYVVPTDLQLQPTARSSSNNSQMLWDGLDLAQGFQVTVTGSHELTPVTMTLVNNMFDVSQCARGSQSPSPIQNLSTPHPQTPEQLTEENIAKLSSLTSQMMVTPTGSPDQLELMEESHRDVLARFGTVSFNHSLNCEMIFQLFVLGLMITAILSFSLTISVTSPRCISIRSPQHSLSISAQW